MDRRHFLLSAGALGSLSLMAPPFAPAVAASPLLGNRILLLVELHGGNDGLNTVIPYSDPLYAELRPKLAIGRDKVLQLDERLGLHPAMSPLMGLWKDGQMAVALGVGYPTPNLSHFRAIEIWNTASQPTEILDEGWVARVFREAGVGTGFTADGVIFGSRSEPGPLYGPKMRVLEIDKPKNFVKRAKRMVQVAEVPTNPALAHIVAVQNDLKSVVGKFIAHDFDSTDPGATFPRNRFGRQMEAAAKLIVSGVEVPVLKVAHGGFDTHRRQAGPHRRLLEQLAGGLEAFAAAMKKNGVWDRVLVMTYAEFGRRAPENASLGTDHGTAAPHFILGGRVRGGLYGEQPPLNDLTRGNLHHRLHFRSLIATATREWWGLPAGFIKEKPLGLVVG
jgi:uncharacterized protein (DUF1501 family)